MAAYRLKPRLALKDVRQPFGQHSSPLDFDLCALLRALSSAVCLLEIGRGQHQRRWCRYVLRRRCIDGQQRLLGTSESNSLNDHMNILATLLS